jgi:hypothetical protein
MQVFHIVARKRATRRVDVLLVDASVLVRGTGAADLGFGAMLM